MRRHKGDVTMIGDKHFTASDGTPEFVYRELVRVRGGWRLKLRGLKGTISELIDRSNA